MSICYIRDCGKTSIQQLKLGEEYELAICNDHLDAANAIFHEAYIQIQEIRDQLMSLKIETGNRIRNLSLPQVKK